MKSISAGEFACGMLYPYKRDDNVMIVKQRGQIVGGRTMRAIGALIGLGLTIADLIGIVVGFTTSIGTGIAALLVPPYGVYLGLRTILGA